MHGKVDYNDGGRGSEHAPIVGARIRGIYDAILIRIRHHTAAAAFLSGARSNENRADSPLLLHNNLYIHKIQFPINHAQRDVAKGDVVAGRVVIALFGETVPRTVENFR